MGELRPFALTANVYGVTGSLNRELVVKLMMAARHATFRERATQLCCFVSVGLCVCVYTVCVCVAARQMEGERQRDRKCVCACVHVSV